MGYRGYGYGGGVIFLGGYGYAYGNHYSYGSYMNSQDRSCNVKDLECQKAAREAQ
jgi:hypothetical protein